MPSLDQTRHRFQVRDEMEILDVEPGLFQEFTASARLWSFARLHNASG